MSKTKTPIIEVNTSKYRQGRGQCEIHVGDAFDRLRLLPDECIHTCITSPPYYGLRDYGEDDQIGLEETPEEYVVNLVAVFREVRRVLRDDGTLWLNLGDSYGKDKQLVGIPWRVAFALQQDGWYLRQDIIWHKPNPMPESVTDRCTNAHEHVFLLSKSKRYYYDHEAIKGAAKHKHTGKVGDRNKGTGKARSAGGLKAPDRSGNFKPVDEKRNKRDVWTITPGKYSEAHFATYPPDLVEPCILAGTSQHGACAECGAPFEREVNRTKATPRQKQGYTANCGARNDGDRPGSFSGHNSETIGWQKACDCANPTPKSCVVLDPFAGSGTTGAVATDHGRDAFLIELNPEYAELAKKRVAEYEPEIKALDFSENMVETLEAIANGQNDDHHWSTLRALRRRDLIGEDDELLIGRSEALGICRWWRSNG